MAPLIVSDDEAALAREAADRISVLIGNACAARGNAVWCLTGGSTPRRLYELLADADGPWRARIDWPRLHLFWGDERHVPPDHDDSNFGMAFASMLRHVPVPPSQLHRMRGEMPDALLAARDYDRELRDGFAAAGRSTLTFDVMLLGMGPDAHIASIFPGSPLLADGSDDRSEATHAALAAAVPGPGNRMRITLTPRALLDSAAIVMLVAGATKAGALRRALEDSSDVTQVPAQVLRAAGDRVEWHVDRAAAARLAQE